MSRFGLAQLGMGPAPLPGMATPKHGTESHQAPPASGGPHGSKKGKPKSGKSAVSHHLSRAVKSDGTGDHASTRKHIFAALSAHKRASKPAAGGIPVPESGTVTGVDVAAASSGA